jgi:sterol desaturase/sphingolipid hydroxylase (fatty acid hydroxylase superfamily)
MYQYIFFLFVIQPLFEYILHRNVHLSNMDLFKIHKQHHIDIHQKKYNSSITVNLLYSLLTLPICFVEYGEFLWLGLFKYQLGHLILHLYPFLFPQLSRFHQVHHKNPKVNYTVTAMWPDKVFGTYAYTHKREQ